MPGKLKYETVKTEIEKSGYQLMSETYEGNKSPIVICCKLCHENYETTYDRYQRGCRHQRCKAKGNERAKVQGFSGTRPITLMDFECVVCRTPYKNRLGSKGRKTCGKEACIQTRRSESGKIGGKAAAAIVVLRSKNEMLFADLCAKHFKILTNEPIFEGWDADVIIPVLSIAILWNGIWHYKKIRDGQNLSQIQARDKVKTSIIRKLGYHVYVIKDMGSYNEKFVNAQYQRFLDFVYFI